MTLALTLPLVGLLISLPGIPGLKKLPKFRSQKAAQDTIPPVWKPHSLLMLENQFVFATLPPIGPRFYGFKVTQDPRRLQVSVDPDSGTVSAVPEVGDVTLGDGARVPINQFNRDLSRENFRRVWAERSRASLNTITGQATGASQRGGLVFEVPIEPPGLYKSILGPGRPAISVAGSENIKLAGTSEWTNAQIGLLGQRRSLFPSLDMEQDLDIRLEGQLSDRVKVNLLQNSSVQIPLANKIAINYRGGEDDLVQALDLGNTNLVLPGTEYVSYSGRNEGLFGMKATTRLGPLDFTVLASKQEGKSERATYTGGSFRQQQTLNDYDYVRGVYFMLYDPSLETQEIDESSIHVYLDEGNSLADQHNATRGRAFVDPRTAKLDSLGADTSQFTPSVRGFFRELTSGPDVDKDFAILNNIYGPRFKVIRLKRSLTGEGQRLAVTYQFRQVINGVVTDSLRSMGGTVAFDTDTLPNGSRATSLTMKLLRAPLNVLPADANGVFFDPSSPFAPTRELEMRNFYNLAGQKIDANTFSLSIRKGSDDPPVRVIEKDGQPVPYTEVLGLDNFNETSGTPARFQRDGYVDRSMLENTTRPWVDFENGTLFFYDLRPFAPRIVDAANYPARRFDQERSDSLFRRETLTGDNAGDPNVRNRAIYDKRNPIRALDTEYFIDVDFTALRATNEINLGRSNILEGSEAVRINGRPLERERDYTIDYDLGRVTLRATPGPTDQVSVDYSYAPLFQQAGRTLLGSAFRLEGKDRHLGGAFMYESKSAQDLRPRIGEEPSRVMIGDLNGAWRARPAFLTRLVDALPGVRTTAPSEFDLTAEIGASFPNPNTYNEVFIDDMEGVKDAVSLAMIPERWTWSSMPSRKDAAGVADTIEAARFTPATKYAEVHWYTPLNAVKERELKPNLNDAQQAQNSRPVLAISVPRRPLGVDPATPLWVGLTYPLDPVGVDLSRAQFIEIWVNDFRDTGKVPPVPGGSLRLHLDLGVVSEDQRRSPGIASNGRLDTEDLLPRDNQLTVTGPQNEDTGLDGRPSNVLPELSDPSLVTSTGNDPAGDNFPTGIAPQVDVNTPINNLDPDIWLPYNGTEGNKDSRPIPDTEDFNFSNGIDRDEHYFQYTIDLADTTYLADVVYAPGRVYANDNSPIPPDNGWRRYRIPISDSLRVRFGSPDLTLTRQLRVWVEGIMQTDDVIDPRWQALGRDAAHAKRPLLMLGGLEIVGSRWLASDLTPKQVTSGTTVTLNSVNTVDNADIYDAPFDPGSTRQGAQDLQRREQSLELEFTSLGGGDTLEVFKTFSLDENYSRYGTLSFYVAGFKIADYHPPVAGTVTDPLYYFVRFASDERGQNYYEYRAPVPSNEELRVDRAEWSGVRLKLTDLSNLKLTNQNQDPIVAPGPEPGVTLIVKGRPSFTRLRRISFGVLNLDPDSTRTFSGGRLWFDEMRATDVAKDRGQAQRLTVTGKMSNLLGYSFVYNARDEDFLSVGETRGSGNRTSNFAATTNLDLHRFFMGTGIIMPVSLTLAGSRAQPRYTAGEDVVRTGALAEASETETANRAYAISYMRTWSERSNPFLRYTLGGISANFAQSRTLNRNPSSVDTSRSTNATVNYSISPRKLLPIPIPGFKAQLFPLPERFFWNYLVASSRSRTYDRRREDGSLVLRNDVRGRSAFVDFGGDFRPIDLLHHQFQAKRNLTLPEQLNERIGFINLGHVVQWNQSFSSRYAANRGRWLRPQFNWSSTYSQNNGPELSPDLSLRAVTNGQTVNINWNLPFDQLAGTPQRPGARPDTLRRARPGWYPLLAWLGAVSLDAGFSRTTGYSRLLGTPSFGYLVGLSADPGLRGDSTGRVIAGFGNTVAQNQDWRTGGRTRLAIGRGATIQTNAELSERKWASNNVLGRTRRVSFPSLDMDYGKLPELLGLKLLFVNPKLRSAYSRNKTTDFTNSLLPTNIATSTEWRPLLGLTGDFKNGTRTEFRIQHRATEAQYLQLGNSVSTEANTDVDLSLSRSYTKGQKMSILGKQSTVKANITLGATAAYSRRKSETRREGEERASNPVAEDRLNVNARGSYGFSNNVTGNAEVGFSQNRDLQTDIVRRSVRVELRAQFTF